MAEKLTSLEVRQVIKMEDGTLTITGIKIQESSLRRGDPEQWYTRVWYTYHSTITGETTKETIDSKTLLGILKRADVI